SPAEELMGAKTLAFTGGVVTLLGVVFFFVLAVNRGWIGPGMRIGCGAFASCLVFAAGLWLQRRYEATYSALAAVGVGIAGAYTSLLAAVSLCDMVSKPVALIVAAAIAAIGVAVSLAWESDVVAAIGLIDAMIAPASFLTGSALFAGLSAALLYGHRDGGLQQGIAQLAAASAYVVLAGILFRRARETATVLWAIGLALGAIGLAEALSGSALTYAWAAEGALLVWLSSRVRDARFQLPALVYLGLA